MSGPVTVTDATFRTEVIESDRPVLVFYWAEWNSTCKGQMPSIRQLAEEQGDALTVALLDVDANPVTPAMFGVTMVPTSMLFRGGEAVARIVGYRRLEVLEAELQAALVSA